MRIGAMIGEISRSLFKRPATERYPYERKPTPERLRGKLMFDAAKCTGCKICVRDCPAMAIELLVVDKATKRFVMRFHSDRCTYCAQCVVSCNFDSLAMSHDVWELAALNRDTFATQLGRTEDIDALTKPKVAAPVVPAADPTAAPA
jgi:formate hydrogenlyase subunit 6/NADH:ubiquinone oxidoreductase subunit I